VQNEEFPAREIGGSGVVLGKSNNVYSASFWFFVFFDVSAGYAAG
jgi:hypothetical protein